MMRGLNIEKLGMNSIPINLHNLEHFFYVLIKTCAYGLGFSVDRKSENIY